MAEYTEHRNFISAGTLAGTTTVDILTGANLLCRAILVKNDSAGAVYQIGWSGNLGTTLPLKAKEEIRLRGKFDWVSLTGAGDYRLVCAEDLTELPDLDSPSTSGGSLYTADEATIHLDGANQFSVKVDGITAAEIAPKVVTVAEIADHTLTGALVDKGIYQFNGLPDSGWINLTVNPADGETVTVTVAGGTTKVYEFDNNGIVVPGNVQVAIGFAASDTCLNLKTQMNLNSTDTDSFNGSNYVDIVVANSALVKAGAALTLATTSGVVVLRDYGSQRAEARVAILSGSRTITASDVTRGTVYFHFRATAVWSAVALVQNSTANVLPWDGSISPGGNSVALINAGTANDFALNDYVTVCAVCTVS